MHLSTAMLLCADHWHASQYFSVCPFSRARSVFSFDGPASNKTRDSCSYNLIQIIGYDLIYVKLNFISGVLAHFLDTTPNDAWDDSGKLESETLITLADKKKILTHVITAHTRSFPLWHNNKTCIFLFKIYVHKSNILHFSYIYIYAIQRFLFSIFKWRKEFLPDAMTFTRLIITIWYDITYNQFIYSTKF